MSQLLCQVVPLKLCQVLQVPNILTIKCTFLVNHFLAIQSQLGHFGCLFISKLYPAFPEADSFASAMLDSVLSCPITFRQQVYSFNLVSRQQFSNIVWCHIRWNSRHIYYTSISNLLLIVLQIFLIFLQQFHKISFLVFLLNLLGVTKTFFIFICFILGVMLFFHYAVRLALFFLLLQLKFVRLIVNLLLIWLLIIQYGFSYIHFLFKSHFSLYLLSHRNHISLRRLSGRINSFELH